MADRAGKGVRVLIVDDIAETRENIKRLLQFESDIEVVGGAQSGGQAIEMARDLLPDVVIMDINMPDMDGISATEAILRDVDFAQIVILSVQNEPNYMQRAMLAGARGFLAKPPSSDELINTIRLLGERAHEQRKRREVVVSAPNQDQAAARPAGKLIAFFSPKGGVGCTMLATNLAIGLHSEATPTALIDASLQFGDAAVFLNLQVKTNIADLALHASELDDHLISDVLIHHESGLEVLAAPPRPEMADEVRPDQVRQVVDAIKRRFEYVVVDTSSTMDDVSLAVLDNADLLVSVATPEIPAIKDARLLFDLLTVLDYPAEQVVFVLNKVERRSGISPEAISENLKREVDATIPSDEKVISASINRGVPLLMEDATRPPAKEIMELVGVLKERLEFRQEEEEEQVEAPRFARRRAQA
jgi:pilus assembly protein CpaE